MENTRKCPSCGGNNIFYLGEFKDSKSGKIKFGYKCEDCYYVWYELTREELEE